MVDAELVGMILGPAAALKLGASRLHVAAGLAEPDVLRQTLFAAAADPAQLNGRDVGERTPLMYAVLKGDPDSVTMLIQSGADVEARDDHGQTAAHWAASHGHRDVLEVLFQWGADWRSREDLGGTVLHWAAVDTEPALLSAVVQHIKDRCVYTSNNFHMFIICRLCYHFVLALSGNNDTALVTGSCEVATFILTLPKLSVSDQGEIL